MRLILLIIALIVLGACNRRQPPVVAPPRVAAPPVAPVPLGPPAPPASTMAIENGSLEFARANYPAAAQNYQQYLNLVPTGGRRDEALFHLGLIYSLPADPRQDWQRALNYFNQVVNEFPTSPLKPAAQLIMTLKSETAQLAAESDTAKLRIRQLSTELERLIKIDSERRAR
jgi:tetratricopeptide (TPR) repeat protein